jgi:prepilin-type N-terminal cleavage/methylation domain-containing protein
MNKSKGFTLIELMICIAICGILVAIALPAFQEYAEDKAAIEQMASDQRVLEQRTAKLKEEVHTL